MHAWLDSTVGDQRLSFEAGTHGRVDQTQGGARLVTLTDASDRPDFNIVGSLMALFRGDFYSSPLAGMGSSSWPFLLRIHPSSEPNHSSLTHLD